MVHSNESSSSPPKSSRALSPGPGDCTATATMDTNGHRERLSLHTFPLRPVFPARRLFSRTSRALASLKKVQHVQVTTMRKSQAKTYYTIDVFYHTRDSRLPLPYARPGRLSPQPQQPQQQRRHSQSNVQVEHTFSEFLDLKNELFLLARRCPHLESCVYCRRMIHFCAFSAVKPHWSTLWFHRNASVCKLLSGFISELLKLAVQMPSSWPAHCGGQEVLPKALLRFLQWSST